MALTHLTLDLEERSQEPLAQGSQIQELEGHSTLLASELQEKARRPRPTRPDPGSAEAERAGLELRPGEEGAGAGAAEGE